MKPESKLSQASFNCEHCKKTIFIPIGLPVTTAPCPHCGEQVTSPDQNMVGESKVDPGEKPPAKTAEEPPAKPVARLEPELEPDKNASQTTNTTPAPMPQAGENSLDLGPKEYVGKKRGRGNTAAVITAVVILLLAGGVTIWLAQQWKRDQQANDQDQTVEKPAGTDDDVLREAWLNTGWKKDATAVLQAFITAKSPEERMRLVIPNENVDQELKIYYSGGKDDADTPVESFVHFTGSKQDRERGIFLMQYRQPAQISIREYFAPIGTLEAILDQEERSMLDIVHRIDEDNLSEPMGINAFFKEIDGELKLDASVFIQGKFRTFKLFTSYPQPGKSKVFRVVVSESLSHHYRNDPTIRTYQFQDFAYSKDFVSLPIEVDSEVGRILSELNWHGENKNRTFKTATVELEWSDERPSKLKLKRMICWEFLGVGGEIGNIGSKSAEPAPPTDPAAGSEE